MNNTINSQEFLLCVASLFAEGFLIVIALSFMILSVCLKNTKFVLVMRNRATKRSLKIYLGVQRYTYLINII